MPDLRELYQQLILDHTKKPRNFGRIDDTEHQAEGFNPLCGDVVTVYLELEDGLVHDIRFEGSGCAISTASASLMTEAIKGCSIDQACAIFERFHGAVTSDPEQPVDVDSLGKLAVLTGVRQFPMRVKCASLAWHTMRSALVGKGETVTTE